MSNSQETHTSVPKEIRVYESDNGDTWCLCENPATGLPAIKHVGNLQSGAHVSYQEVEAFLSAGAGPEHQALRDVLKQEHVATILIACDVHQTQSSSYDDLVEAIQALGAWWHHLETVWVVRSDKTLREIRDSLAAHIGVDDQILVVDITGVGAEWAGLNEAGSSWLRGNIKRDALVA